MTGLRAILLGLLLLIPGLMLDTALAQDKEAEKSAQRAYSRLQKEFDQSLSAFRKALDTATTAKERTEALRLQPSTEEYAAKFMALAQKSASGKAAFDPLVWVIMHPVPAASTQAKLRVQALTTLARDHIRDPRLGRLCTQMVFSLDAPAEQFLRTVLAKAPTKGVKARACGSLAHTLKFRARLIGTLRSDPAALKEFQSVWGKAVIDRLLKGDPKTMLAESEKLFQTLGDTYGDLVHPLHGTLAELSKWHLLSIRRPITIDKAGPNVYGEDIDGKKLVLRDYSGKVILLDFWTSYFAPCRQALPYERKLVARMEGKPFVLIGVNGDGDRKALKKYVKDAKITWRSYYDGGGTGGPIATRWEVDNWPTLVLIDHKGVVRGIYEGWPEAKALDADINKLVQEARQAKKDR